jgi:murein DD-endopeptidase MepM/ murein hydrolase activator NlpD
LIDRRIGAIVAMVLAVVVGLQVCAIGAKKPAQLKNKLGSVRKQIKQVQYKIHLKEAQKKTVVGQLSVVESKLDDAQDKLTSNSIKLFDAQNDLKATIDRLDKTKKRLVRHQTLLRHRIVDIYEGEDLNYVDVVLGSTNMWTFLSRAYYLQQILKADTSLISQVRALKASIEADKSRQASRVVQIGSLQNQLVGERKQISSLADSKQQQIDRIEHDTRLMEQALAELEAESQAIEDQIRRYQSTPAGIKRSARAFHGGLTFPVSGRITSTFGYRVHPITHIYKLHTGVDISVPTGTPVHAAADGTIIIAGWMPAYGYEVVIDHGGGVQTLYGHNSRLCVSVGQDVKRGQVIAKSGSTGYSTGPHVHFEKRVNGHPVNPGGG